MRMFRWRSLALGAATAMLGLTLAACGDDTTGNDLGGGQPDLSATAKPDMTAGGNVDMTAVAPDMTAPPPGNGQLLAADVSGTVYAPNGDGGTMPIPLTHSLAVVASFPQFSTPSDYSNLQINVAALSVVGCAANRYDIAKGVVPGKSVDVGNVTATGYNTQRIAAGGPAAQSGFFAPPISDGVTCKLNGTTGQYDCAYNGTANGQTVAGLPIGMIGFPPIPSPNWTQLCAALSGGNATQAANCTAACDQTGHPGTCEQWLWTPKTATNQATLAVAGGNGYSAQNTKIGNGSAMGATLPDSVHIISATVGTGAAGADLASLSGKLDPAMPVTITWSCDGTATAGSGCDTAPGKELFILVAQTSKNPKESFGSPPSAQFGTMNCFEQVKKGTFTVQAGAIAALLGQVNGGTKQTGGSARITALTVLGNPILGAGQIQLHAAGHGEFTFIDLP